MSVVKRGRPAKKVKSKKQENVERARRLKNNVSEAVKDIFEALLTSEHTIHEETLKAVVSGLKSIEYKVGLLADGYED